MAKKCPIGGVWKVSGGCWGVSGGCLDDSRGYDVPALVNIQLDSSLLAAFFSHSGLGMDKKCPYLGCLWGVCKVSVWCLDGLEVIWDTSMGDKIVILNEKVQSLSYNSHTTFSPSAHFLAKIGQKWRIFRPLLRGVKRHFWSKSIYSPGFIHKTAPKNAWERSTLNQSPP